MMTMTVHGKWTLIRDLVGRQVELIGTHVPPVATIKTVNQYGFMVDVGAQYIAPNYMFHWFNEGHTWKWRE